MPQLTPFYFTNQTFAIFIFGIIVAYLFSKYILPQNLSVFCSRIYISSKWNSLLPKKSKVESNVLGGSDEPIWWVVKFFVVLSVTLGFIYLNTTNFESEISNLYTDLSNLCGINFTEMESSGIITNSCDTCETNHSKIVTTRKDPCILNSTSPLSQFEIKDFLTLVIIGIALRVSNLTVVTGLSAASIIVVNLINNNERKLVPTRSSVLLEAIYHSVLNIVISQIDNKKGQMFFPFLFSIFIIILSNNLVGMIPYSLASTSEFILTFSLSFTVVIGSTILSLIKYAFIFFSILVPSGCPLPLLYLLTLIEFISYLARPVSLGLRLAANVLSGHMLLLILSGFAYKMIQNGYLNSLLSLLPLSFIICFTALEMGIAIIQAQVFTVLSSSYIKDGLKLH